MHLIDTHCHLNFPDFASDVDAVLERARRADVRYIINVSSDMQGCVDSVALAARYPQVYASVGVHPHDVRALDDGAFARVAALCGEKKVVAIGEIGLDYFKEHSPRPVQQAWLRRFLALACERQLPVIFHAREAYEDLFAIAGEFPKLRRAVLHCFSGSRDVLAHALDRGWHISFTCTITYKNAQGLREVAGYAPLERIMVETDAPFLAPQRVRGTRGEPAFVVDAAQALADVKKISLEEFARAATTTACDFFNIPDPYLTTL